MITESKLRKLAPQAAPYKVTDRDGMYIVVSPAGAKTFRYDYRLNGRRESLTLGRFPELSLEDARARLAVARRQVADGVSPAIEKAATKKRARAALTFGAASTIWMRTTMADRTRENRLRILGKELLPVLGNRLLPEITSEALTELFDQLKARGAPTIALQAREIVSAVYAHMAGRGVAVANPAAAIKPSTITVLVPRERWLRPHEIGIFFRTLEHVSAAQQLKLGLKLLLLTMVRKSELTGTTWQEVDFDSMTWTIPAERMKGGREHVVALSAQAIDILQELRAMGSEYLVPGIDGGRLSDAALNRVVSVTCDLAGMERCCPHDFRRTASSLLHGAGFASDWIEKQLAHTIGGIRGVYNQAQYEPERREMLQAWATMIDGYINPTVMLRAA